MDNQQATLTDANIAWLAGIIEGEGSLAMNAYDRKDRGSNLKVQTSIMVYNTDAGIINQVLAVIDSMGVSYYVKEREQKPMKHEGGYYMPTSSMLCVLVKSLSNSVKLLTAIRPWLYGDKAARADIMLRYLTRRVAKIEANGGNHRNLKMDAEDFSSVAEFYTITKRSNPNTVKRVLNELERCTREAA
jgi:hypothetical protein